MDEPPIKCRTCKHWTPLFSGEVWGVRSFVDAPPEAQAEIRAKLDAYFKENGYTTVEGALGYEYLCSVEDDDQGIVPDGPDWPEWGECQLTELHNEASKKSLARAIDGSAYRAVLRCHQDFACMQWEEFVAPPTPPAEPKSH